MMYGIDISNHQKSIRLGRFDFDFAIIKATEGATFKDKSFNSHVSQILGLNKLIGCYHYLRPDNQTTTGAIAREAHNFIDSVNSAGLIGRALLFADWEQQPMDRLDLLVAFLETVEKETGITPFVYSSSSWFRNSVDWNNYEIDNPLWIASWPGINEFTTWPELEWIESHKPNIAHKIWQFSSKGRVPGYRGYVDLDFTTMEPSEWKQLACGKPIENITSDMQWTIDIGVFHGFPDGTYRPNEMLTRSQCASVVKRYHDYLLKSFETD